MRRASLRTAPLALVLVLAVSDVAAQEPSSAPAAPAQPPPSGAPTPPADPELERALEEAAKADAQAQSGGKGADATQAQDRRAEDPLRLAFGKEILGNESNPAISLILDVVGSYFSRADRVPLEGHVPTATGVSVTGAELAASASVDPYFRFDMAFALAHLELEEIYLTTLSLPLDLQARAGQFLSKVGRHNPTHPHSWHFVLNPLPNQFLFGAEGLGGPGAEVSWLAPLPWYVELIGALQVGEGGAFRTKPLTEGDPRFEDFIYPVRLVQFFDLSDDWALQLGTNAVFGTSALEPQVGHRTYAFGGDLLLKWRPIGQGQTGYTYLAWVTEFWLRKMEVPTDVWQDVGGYTDLIVGISKRWEVGARFELWRRVGGEAPTALNSRSQFGLDSERASLALSFLPSHFSRARLQ
ncbi:MAG: hypothetical protein HY901_38540, partial [Deltaproteobacteria bacterium]|nr:hypothetical protein [Deltaproteobacteria bacterium]